MTAYRIVTDHQELENIGQLTHGQLDGYVQRTAWVVVSGSTGPFPDSARRLAAGVGISINDAGPNGDLVISASGTEASIQWNEVPSGAVDGTNMTFNLTFSPVPSSALMFFINGVKQRQGSDSDYTLSGHVVTLLTNYRSGSNIDATYPY
jgi:hypothetical protein